MSWYNEIVRGFQQSPARCEPIFWRVLISEDTRRDDGEPRQIALGEHDGDVIRTVFTERGNDIRIISAWKAGRHDREVYEKARTDRQV